ncbi:MAG: hypothetical protein J6I56_03770, partial [Lachnospiraceae bacterium]|nr:hypothetical protein [Lachnospiraceae bacterium]
MHKKLNLFKNPVLKVVSLLLAILLWVLVSNINDPVIYRQFSNIPVEIRNANRITEQGQVYRVLDETDIVGTVTIGAQRTKAEQLTADNIIAVADVDELTQLGTVPIRFSTNLYSGDLESIKGNIDYVRLDIENRKSTVFALQTTTSGALAEGYTLSDITTEQNQIRVTGPESIVSSISKAVANVDVSGARNTIVTYADIRLYDQNDRQISKEGLTMNITNVRVTVNILSAKTLPLTFSTTGAPADGYLRSGTITANPSEILVKGRSSVLNSIDRIDIPAEVLDVTGRTSDLVQEVDITPYLPDNVSFAQDDFEGLTEVRVGIVQAHARSIEIPIGAIR